MEPDLRPGGACDSRQITASSVWGIQDGEEAEGPENARGVVAMLGESQENVRQELLSLMEEVAARCWYGRRWQGAMDYPLWRMAHGGSAQGWPEGRLPSEEDLRRLRELSQRARGWWHRSVFLGQAAEGETGTKVFIPLSFWRWHYPVALVALHLAIALGLLLDVLIALFVVTLVPFANQNWSPFVSWPVGILAGLFGFVVLRWCDSTQLIILLLLSPILWLTIGCRKLPP